MKRLVSMLLLAAMLLLLCSCSEDKIASSGNTLAGYDGGNKAVDYSFEYPEDWELSSNDGVVAIKIDCDGSSSTSRYATINVMAFTLSDDQKNCGARDYWNTHSGEIESTYGDYSLLDEAEISIDGIPALRVKYTGSLTENVYTFSQSICIRNGVVYLITLSALQDDFDNVFADYETVLNTFYFN